MPLPDAVVTSIVRGMSAYLASARPTDVPSTLKPLRNKHLKMLMGRKKEIVSALDDDAFRALVLDWLNDDPQGISKTDAVVLRAASERPDGWQERLDASTPRPKQKPEIKDRAAEIEREKQRAKKAKEEARRAKEEASQEVAAERARASSLQTRVEELEAELKIVRKAATDALKERDAALSEMEREVRKAKKSVERAQAALDESKALVRDLRKRAPTASATPEARPRKKRPVPAVVPEPARRARLPVPKGRLEDASETLSEWLSIPEVHLLVDGYNVTKAEKGFGDLELQAQRTRLVDEVTKLARKHKIKATVVFDGSHIPPGTSRRARGPVEVEYSRPDEIADDHLIAKLEGLPKHPVVVATNDRELQNRAARLGATIARSDQLLALIRR